jgi:hypothetical protein
LTQGAPIDQGSPTTVKATAGKQSYA